MVHAGVFGIFVATNHLERLDKDTLLVKGVQVGSFTVSTNVALFGAVSAVIHVIFILIFF